MGMMIFKIVLSSSVIAFASWLSGFRPQLAGFLVALPLTSLIVIPLSFYEWQDPEKSVVFAKSILYALPLSMMFFIPFLFADLIRLGFWGRYFSGIGLLVVGYSIFTYFVGSNS